MLYPLSYRGRQSPGEYSDAALADADGPTFMNLRGGRRRHARRRPIRNGSICRISVSRRAGFQRPAAKDAPGNPATRRIARSR